MSDNLPWSTRWKERIASARRRKFENMIGGVKTASGYFFRRSEARLLFPESLPPESGGRDRRERLSLQMASTFPYGSICRIWGEGRDGTGFLVSGGRILTAGHVVKDATIRNVQFPGHPQFKVSISNRHIWWHDQFSQEGDLFDRGIITPPPEMIAGIAALPTVTPTASLLTQIICEVAGYPRELDVLVRFPPARNPAFDTRVLLNLADGYLEHKLDTTAGQSGAPMLARTLQNPSQIFAIGMHIWGAGNFTPGFLNKALPLGTG